MWLNHMQCSKKQSEVRPNYHRLVTSCLFMRMFFGQHCIVEGLLFLSFHSRHTDQFCGLRRLAPLCAHFWSRILSLFVTLPPWVHPINKVPIWNFPNCNLYLSFDCPCGVDENNPDQNVYKNGKTGDELNRIVGEKFIPIGIDININIGIDIVILQEVKMWKRRTPGLSMLLSSPLV